MRIFQITVILTALFLCQFSQASNWEFRAREHYEWHQVSFEGGKYDYKGFGNTINFWNEKPFDRSFGLAFGSIITSARSNQAEDSFVFGDQIRLYTLGLEVKYFNPLGILKKLFLRGGLGLNLFENESSLGNLNGQSLYLGVGYEFLIYKKIGLAFELAQRLTDLQNGVTVSTFSPSVGLHFYDF